MRQGWFDHVDEMLRTVGESTEEQWDCSAIKELFKEKVSTSYTIISAIGPSPQGGPGNRRSVSTQALKEFLQEFHTILKSDPRPKAIETARLLFRQKVKSKSHQEPKLADKFEADLENPNRSTTTASGHFDPISKGYESAHSITPAEVANQPLSDRLHPQEIIAMKSPIPEECEEESLYQANWWCKYYIAFVPRALYMTHYEKYRRRLSKQFGNLAEQIGCRAVGGEINPDHVFVIISVPPYAEVTSVAKHLREESSHLMMKGIEDSEPNGRGRGFWSRGYFAPLTSFELDAIRKLMTNEIGRINGQNENMSPA